MENILKNLPLPKDEIKFLTENESLTTYFFNQLNDVINKNEEKIILCKNSYERRFVHILSNALGLYHNRHIERDKKMFDNVFDYQCKCKYCWEIAGKKSLIINVKVSPHLLPLSKKDIIHQKNCKIIK